ncbi:cell surface protein SprA [Chryseobacterium taklimakanense]|uniref:T9SS outer membrane translocon Sov/SprA n=1 Tax=Chryseobacterium taklimakanense TaxID=536441 RepID=UPI000F5E5251|nr:cell surface protein SprA [Chryseobacterium taklimakanense]AZI22161.1 cell surface protein SprA [Chryseobacterium taklimakanense]
MRKNFIIYRLSVFLFLFFSFAKSTAQAVPQDSISIRKEFSLPNPTRYEAFYDVETGMYFLYPKIGNTVIGAPTVMTVREYQDYVMSTQLADYYREKSANYNVIFRKDQTEAQKKGLIPAVLVKNKLFESIFGSNKIELIPQGFASFDLGGLYQKIDNPLILPQNRSNFAINIQQRIQLGLLGKVGENLQLRANYDTQSGFAFENRMNLVWQAKGTWKDLQSKGLNDPTTGGEDKIIKRVEFGNVNMPLSTGLIRGSQSLFGLKTEFQLGKTYGTMVFSQQQGEARNIVVQGGGALQTFKINAIDYEENQHYYLGHYFLNNYDNALLNYPLINSKININRIEAWVLEQGSGNLQDQKSIIGIRDLGEGTSGYPSNLQNNLYQNISNLGAGLRDPNTAYNTIKGQSFPNANGVPEVYIDGEQFIFNRKARRLNPNEFTYDRQLGYLSLNQKLNDNQLLAVAYSYTVNGERTVYKVGEFSEESPVLITKLLKPNTTVKTTSPMWNLMMKNVYPINANQISQENFAANVYYNSPQNGKVNYLPGTNVQDINLLKLLNWDRLNLNNDLQNNGTDTGDGLFDFVEGITIKSQDGKLIFTKSQPFGSYMQNVLGSSDPQFVFTDLYTQQKQIAAQSNLALRYTIEGRFKGTQGSGIALGALNIPQGSVKVTANGVQLIEGQDYTVDYMFGTVNIINEQIKNSGQAINISMESQLMFNTQRKRFLGLNLERKFSENLLLGATVVNYAERPLTQKVNFGDEAVNNTMAGMNLMFNKEVPFLTRLADKIPLVNTEAPSSINFKAEGAYLVPGQNKGINDQSYIDDFEQSSTKISIKDPAMWSLASKPEKNFNDPIYNNAGLNDNLQSGYGRGLLSWYNIDPRFWGVGGKAPSGINAQTVSNHASRRVHMSEILNNRDFVAGEQTFTNTFDITFYPAERGPYNVNPNQESVLQRWGGLMRPISVSNFTNSNIEYVEFWMMDPYADGKAVGNAPKLKLQLGNVSEDVLKDGKLQYENGLPTPNSPSSVSTTNWGKQPNQFPVLYAFSSEGDERTRQDAGYDGLNNEEEAVKFNTSFINPVTNELDPAADDFVYYLSNKFTGAQASSLTERYKYFRNPEGNSKSGSLEVSSQTPDAEDVNRDYNLDQNESYNQYTISLDKASLVLNQNFIADVKEVKSKFQNGQEATNKWYLFRVPVSQFDPNAGDASKDVLNNVRFARIILDGFEETSTLRFGTMDLVRSAWRKYNKNIAASNIPPDPSLPDNEGSILVNNDDFFVGSVNLEENALGTPPYVLPPGIDRQVLSGNAGAQRQNESSLFMKFLNLGNDAKGVTKNTFIDMRRYKKLELFVHAEDIKAGAPSNQLDENTKFFIRFGSDATDNYYEYEASLQYTPKNAKSPLEIWPAENNVDLEIQNFVDAKLKRDQEAANLIGYRYHYAAYGDTNKKIYVKGRPSLGNITTMMIGVRNLQAQSKDLILWVNEIRLSEIENKGGYAGNASLNFNLGDFAVVNANAAYSTVGFGAIDQKPVERAQATNSGFNINTTVNVDKFIPEKVGMRIPVNYSYTQTIEDPKYNPIDTDVEFQKASNKEELKKVARTYTQQRSISVVNMRKERMNENSKPRFYDVENLSFTAIYNDDFYRDVYTKRNYRQFLRSYLDYNYSFKPYVLRPFKNLVSDTAKSYKYLRWIREFNFNPVPTTFSFRTELDRNYNEMQFRNVESLLNGNQGSEFDILKTRNFYFGWQYNLGFKFTNSLKMEVNSATRTLNDNIAANTMNTKSIFENPFRAGRPVLYNHRVQLNYRLPFEFLPHLDFINAEVGYGFTYNWNARSNVLLNSPAGNLGNISQNTNNKVVTASVDMPQFFRKFKFFRDIDQTMLKRGREIDSLNNINSEEALKIAKKNKFFIFNKYKGHKFKNRLTPFQSIAYALTSIRQLDINYNENNGTVLPGILSSPNFYGYGQGIGGPTYGFLLGSQADIRRVAIENSWLTTSELLNDPFSQLSSKTFDANLQIMPLNDLRIDLNGMMRYNRNMLQGGFNLDADPSTPYFDFAFENELLTYSRSNWMFRTSFKSGESIYENMIANAKAISAQLGSGTSNNGYSDGYSLANAYVLIPAFQAAVEGRGTKTLANPTKVGVPLPNWRVTYSGLSNIPLINSQFSKFDILHAYNSTYTGTGIQSNIDFYNDPNSRDINNDFVNPYVFSTVGYVESFSPLLGADVTLRNNMRLSAQYNKDRLFMLGLVNHTLTEDDSREYIVGFGYLVKDLKLKLNVRGKSKNITSDLNIKGDFSLRDSRTRITNILLDDSQVTGGQKLLGVKLTADYNMSQNFNIRLFYDQLMTKYKISTAFPLSTIRAGITATFNFGGAPSY